MKAAILKLIDNHISTAADNAGRAKWAFGNMTEAQLDGQYGESGRTCRQVMTEASNTLASAKAMKSWFEANVK